MQEVTEQRQHHGRITDRNLAAVFYSRAKRLGDLPCVAYKEKKQPYRTISWREFSKMVQQLSLGLMSTGLRPNEKAAIFSATCYPWVAADLATISNGAISVPIYPTSSASDIEFIVNNSQARIIFVQNEALLKRMLAVKDSLPNVQKLVLFNIGDKVANTDELAAKYNVPASYLTDLDSLRKIGASLDSAHLKILEDRMKATSRDGMATIIYTSGTTGVPKGVPLTHGNIMSILEDIKPVLPIDENEVYLSYLPLSHIFERICGEFYWLTNGGMCAFAESIETMARNLAEVEASMLLCVPRVLDKIYSKVKAGLDETTGRKRQLIDWALAVGHEVVRKQGEGKFIGPILLAKQAIAEKLVFKKLRQKIGPRLRLVVSGGAPASVETMGFFAAIGLACLEGYGLTETSAPTNVNRYKHVKVGTVGPKMDSVEQKLGEDGEVMVKGPSIFKGYYDNPQATAEAFEGEWFKTGDIGVIDKDGYLKIVDRKKDIIVNSSGKNIAPQRVEAVLKTVPFVTQAVVFGDKQKHLVALLSLDEEAVCEFARNDNWEFDSYFDLCRSQNLHQYLKKEIEARSTGLADYEKVHRFAVMSSEFSVEAGELTASLKIKRSVVAKNYRPIVEALYANTYEPSLRPASSARAAQEDLQREIVPV
ncbi:MAG: long-chain fatty acid--CoA ligase [Cyanobacteria bacterium SZAS LIN-2]|nr:long-chain fatty acid--CoA ligase [Cyanobacteria bacterium SZAS LIN-3]MBS1996576.1 long-chain fatty acid--CoA ligase [Cyanobacteria bacterium SZAS LIN-2]MBS2006558.1 long-chain fatty acid--CoA ligase [Cyanobacteria bacterium SZAS TMP-1]